MPKHLLCGALLAWRLVDASAGGGTTSRYAAIGVVDATKPGAGSVKTTVGQPTKHSANPLFVQDKPWEPRIDNGYPNVVPPAHDGDPWQVFYGTCQKSCGTQILLYANSSDGLRWQKPELGIFDIGTIRPDLKSIGTHNNVLLVGGGIGVIRDANEPNPAHRYKAFGPGCYSTTASADGGCGLTFEDGTLEYPSEDLAFSADGLRWSDARSVSFPAPQRWDCHNNLEWDAASQVWLATTRDGFSAPPGRTIGIATAPATLEFPSVAPIETLAGSDDMQLYSQITFAWHQIFLGIVMVYEASSKDQKVRCRLAWAQAPHDAKSWKWVEGGLSGPEFIPLGRGSDFDSHICFAAKSPTSVTGASPHERIYYMGGNGPHSGARNSSFGLATLRPDGFAALTAEAGSVFTVPLKVTGRTLVVSVDFAPGAPSRSLRIGTAHGGPLAADASIPISANGTDVAVAYAGGADWSGLMNSSVQLEIRLKGASIYTLGWTD